MEFELDQVEARVLGAMMEKEAATPDNYPLSLNALRMACNQKSNRHPVMDLEEGDVQAAIDSLRAKGLGVEITTGRVHKFRHRAGEVFNFDRREHAVICVLLLRGPQTPGELRGRTERLHEFDDLDAVHSTLNRLMERTPPLVTKLPRRPGEKESRFAHLLSGEVEVDEMEAPPPPTRAGYEERISRLETELAELKQEFDEFRRNFE